jgi:transposase
MRDRDLYATILGITPPWEVIDVAVDSEQRLVEVRLATKPGTQLSCPECGKPVSGYDTRERRWRHLDTCQFRTELVATVPRVDCGEHGVRQMKIPWAQDGSRFTALFEALAIDWMKEASLSGVTRVLGLTWDEAAGIQQRAVERGLARRARPVPTRIGVDETSFAKRHEYVTVISDQETGAVVSIADGRGCETLAAFYRGFSPDELAAIESVSMDMWAGYIGPTLEHVPDARRKIAFDKFHVAQHLGKAVDVVRRREHTARSAAGDTVLTKTKYLWLRNPEKMSKQAWARLRPLREGTLRTAKAWFYKEWGMRLWHYRTRGWAERGWSAWYRSAIHTKLEEVKTVARMVKSHLYGIVNAVVSGVTNAAAEGLNSRIQHIKAQARGYRNRMRFRQAIYFHFGQLDLYPAGVSARSTHTIS